MNYSVDRRTTPRFPFRSKVKIYSSSSYPKVLEVQSIDISENGLGITSPHPIGDKNLATLQILSYNYGVLEIKGKIVWSEKTSKDGIYRCGIRFEDLEESKEFIIRRLIDKLQEIANLNAEFVQTVQKCKKYLQEVEKYCNEFDFHQPVEKQIISFINEFKKDVYERLYHYSKSLQEYTKHMSKPEYKKHLNYIRKELSPYMVRRTTVVNRHIYEKPLGYPGDFIISKYFYADRYTGSTTYSILMDRFTLEAPTARAHINRRKYFYNKIVSLLENNWKKVTKISSYACGPAVEILDVIKNYKPSIKQKVILNCIDGEKLAIKELRKEIREAFKFKSRKFIVKLNLINENVLTLVRRNTTRKIQKNQDFIYCAGFLDYLSDNIARKVIEYFYSLLKEEGILIVVNVAAENPFKIFMEAFGEWYIYHRTPQDLLNLCDKIKSHSQIFVETEPETGMNHFLIIRK